MPRRLLPIFLLLLGACAPLPGGRGGPPGDGAANERPSAATSAATDQQQALLAETAAALKLTPRQLVLWESYQQKVGALMADQVRAESPPRGRFSAPQQIDSRVATVRHRLAAIEDVEQAANALYESLDAEQRRIADQRLAATVPPLYSGLISCFTAPPARDAPGGAPGGAPPPRR